MTASNQPPAFDGATPHARAVALAGWLAENGEQRVSITNGRGTRTLSARTTDLPGEIVNDAPCTVVADSLRVAFRVEPHSITLLGA